MNNSGMSMTIKVMKNGSGKSALHTTVRVPGKSYILPSAFLVRVRKQSIFPRPDITSQSRKLGFLARIQYVRKGSRSKCITVPTDIV